MCQACHLPKVKKKQFISVNVITFLTVLYKFLADENGELKTIEIIVPSKQDPNRPIGERQSPDGQEEPKSSSNLGSKSCGRVLFLISLFTWSNLESLSEDVGGDNEETIPSSNILPWFTRKGIQTPTSVQIETSLKPGEYVMRNLFAEFIVQADKKITTVMAEPFVSVASHVYVVPYINWKFIWRSGHCPNHFKEVKTPNLTSCSVRLVLWLNTVCRPSSEYCLLGSNGRESSGCQVASTNRKETPNEGNLSITMRFHSDD